MSAVIAMWSGGEAISSPILQDRGFHYGDGLFETILFEGGGLQFWQRHLDRLELGCQRLGLQMPALSGVIEHLSQVLPIDVRAVVKLIVTAGITGRGYGRDVTEGGLHCLSYESIDVPDKNSVALSTSPVRLSRQPLLAGLKHLNRLEQVLAKRSLPEGCFEGLMLDTEGLVVEGIMSNVFYQKGATLITPSLAFSGVAGIMRGIVMESAPECGLEVVETAFKPKEMLEADAIFICNSLMGLRSVTEWGEWRPQKAPCLAVMNAAILQKQQQEQLNLKLGCSRA